MSSATRIADFSAKLGKLVDRRGALSKAMSGAGHPPEVIGVLVCRQPRDQIAIDKTDLHSKKIRLVAREELVTGLEYALHPPDPDELIVRLRKELGL